LELPYGTAFDDGRRSEWEAVKEAIHETAEGCDLVVLLGDNLNSRHNHSSVIREFVEFLNGFGNKEVHIIIGNHERYGNKTALDFLKKVDHPNWHLYTDVQNIESNGLKMTFMPFMTPGSLDVKDNAEATKKLLDQSLGGDILFTHHAIENSTWGSGDTEHMNEPVLPLTTIEARYGRIFGGHIHKSQWLSPKTLVTGNIFPSEVGEELKSVWILDTTQDKVIEVKLPVRGIYKVHIRQENSMTFAKIPKNSIVKCILTERTANVENIRQMASQFDAYIIVEQYPREREKVHFQEGSLDLTVDNMLKVYSDVRKIDYSDLKTGFDIIRS
jgi:calcineurin-like phosphoesterase family protein